MNRRHLLQALVFLGGLASAGGAVAASGLTYLAHEPPNTPAHAPLIVLLHGSGADERDMIGLWSQLPGAFIVVSPRGPFADGAGGYRWYGKGAGAGRAADIQTSKRAIDTLVEDAVKRFDADPKRLFLAGFSQGAVMAYAVAFGEPGRFRGAAVLSGSLRASDIAHLSAKADRASEAFFIAHGTADQRIPFGSATAARALLAKLKVPVEFHAYPGMGHTVGEAETRDLSAWLSERAALQPGPAAP